MFRDRSEWSAAEFLETAPKGCSFVKTRFLGRLIGKN